MAGPVTIAISGMAELERVLAEAAQRLQDMSPVMLAISEELYAAVAKNFETGGARLGSVWPGL